MKKPKQSRTVCGHRMGYELADLRQATSNPKYPYPEIAGEVAITDFCNPQELNAWVRYHKELGWKTLPADDPQLSRFGVVVYRNDLDGKEEAQFATVRLCDSRTFLSKRPGHSPSTVACKVKIPR